MPKRSTSEIQDDPALSELAEMLAGLLELARRLPPGRNRRGILKEILGFNARLARLEQSRRRPKPARSADGG
jgi:hypothetical protein